jgi:enoyl-CoA hydratase/carnithine racemase
MTVGYEVNEGIAAISFNRPEKHNALRDEDIQALADAIRRLDADDDAQVGIVFGHGRSFSSGGDVNARLQASMEEGSTASRTTEGDAFYDCSNWKPVIAAVHGYCLGHALGTALQCDLLVASRNARFQVTEITIGLPTPALLPRLGHPAFANDVCMTGRMFTADEAWQGGMLTRLVDDGEHLDAAEELARAVLQNPQSAVREQVRVRRTAVSETAARYQGLVRDFAAGWATDSEAREAVAARAAKMRYAAARNRQENDPGTSGRGSPRGQ